MAIRRIKVTPRRRKRRFVDANETVIYMDGLFSCLEVVLSRCYRIFSYFYSYTYSPANEMTF